MTTQEETTRLAARKRAAEARAVADALMGRLDDGEDPAVIGPLWDAAMTSLHTAEDEVASLHRATRGLRKQRGA